MIDILKEFRAIVNVFLFIDFRCCLCIVVINKLFRGIELVIIHLRSMLFMVAAMHFTSFLFFGTDSNSHFNILPLLSLFLSFEVGLQSYRILMESI